MTDATTPDAGTVDVKAADRRYSHPGNPRGTRGNPNVKHHDQRHPGARFDDATVRRIRRRVADGVSMVVIAEALGCSRDTIANMTTGRKGYRTYGGVT